MGDLIAENNEPITKCKLREVNVSPLDAFQLASVNDALPVAWRQFIKKPASALVLFLLAYMIRLRFFQMAKRFRRVMPSQKSSTKDFKIQTGKKIKSLSFRVTLDTKTRVSI